VSTPGTVFVEAPARLHFGVLDLRGSLGRWFGGIGAAAPAPTLLVSAAPADATTATGPDAARATEFAQRFLRHHGITGGARIEIHRALPPHAGLGSGTQLALAVSRALAEIYALPADPVSLAVASGRGRRSAIGTWVFAHGGLVVEGGRPRTGDVCGPLIARVELPATWHCVVAVPAGEPALSGAAEAEAFARLPEPPQAEVERVAHLVLMALLPAAAEGDLALFGRALTDIQRLTGGWFAAVQGDTFAAGATRQLIEQLTRQGAAGVGQSSWGPAVYGIVDGEPEAARLAQIIRTGLGLHGAVYHGPFPAHGARVWHAGS
jgi:beta-ribofuranosylaminobenzene 5'-phosphate synthase